MGYADTMFTLGAINTSLAALTNGLEVKSMGGTWGQAALTTGTTLTGGLAWNMGISDHNLRFHGDSSGYLFNPYTNPSFNPGLSTSMALGMMGAFSSTPWLFFQAPIYNHMFSFCPTMPFMGMGGHFGGGFGMGMPYMSFWS